MALLNKSALVVFKNILQVWLTVIQGPFLVNLWRALECVYSLQAIKNKIGMSPFIIDYLMSK